jgi:F-type H+-transporting ATPase subunit a
MEHHYSYLFGPVNRLLVALFGEPSERWLQLMGAEPGQVFWLPDHVLMALLVVGLVTLLVIPVSRRLSVETPSKLQQVFEMLVSGVHSMVEEVVGHGSGRRFMPFILSLAVFIFIGNIFGLFYFIQPPTANTSTTFALSLTTFVFFTVVGLKDNGLLKYLAHFCGPIWWLAPIMFPIEVISNLARILSLALRLFGNIFGEHTATGRFFLLFPFLLPWPMMGLGIFGALLQSFIFIMMTMSYLQGAVAQEEH